MEIEGGELCSVELEPSYPKILNHLQGEAESVFLL